jgi:hypothetical protein
MFKKLLIIAWVGLVGLTVSCKGPQGDVGPQGEKGDTGAVGPAGPAGQDGEGSGDGNGSFVFTNGADTTDAEGNFYSGLTFPNASDAALFENSAVLVYIKSQGVYWPLPGIVSFGQNAQDNKFSNFTFVHYIDGSSFFIDILMTSWSEEQNTVPTRIAQDIKVIVVPSQLLGRVNGELKTKTYEEAMSILGLTEKDVKTAITRE